MHLFGVPDIAGLIADPNPWWVWSSDGTRLLLANAVAVNAMGEAESSAIGESFSANHRFAAQIITFAPLLRHDDQRHQIFLTLFDKNPPRTAIIHGQRVAVGDNYVLVFRSSQRSRQGTQDAAAAFVANAPMKLALFSPQGRLEAVSASCTLARGTSFEGLFGDQADDLKAQLDLSGIAEVPHMGGSFHLALMGQSQRILLAMEDAQVPEAAASEPDEPVLSDEPDEPALDDEPAVLSEAAVEPSEAVENAIGDLSSAQEPTDDDQEALVLTIVPQSSDNSALTLPPVAPLAQVPEGPETAAITMEFDAAPEEAATEAAEAADSEAQHPPSVEEKRDDDGEDVPAEAADDAENPPPVPVQETASSPLPVHKPLWQRASAMRSLWRSDAHGVITAFDAPFTQWVGQGWTQILGNDEEAHPLLAALSSGKSFAGLSFVLPADGSKRRYRVSGAAQTDASGHFCGYQGFCLAEAVEPEQEATPQAAIAPLPAAPQDRDLPPRKDEDVALAAADIGNAAAHEVAADSPEAADEADLFDPIDPSDDDAAATAEPPLDADRTSAQSPEEPQAKRPQPNLSLVPQSPNVVGFPGGNGGKSLLDTAKAPVTPEQIEHNIEKLLERIKQRRSPFADRAVSTPEAPRDDKAAPEAPLVPHGPEHLNLEVLMRMVRPASDAASEPAEPAKFGPPAPTAAELRSRTQNDIANLLSALPMGVLIQRGNHVLYANETLLSWTGHADRDALERDGGDARLFAGEDSDHAITHHDGKVRPVNVRLSRINWDGDKAMVYAFSLKEPEETVSHPAPDMSGVEDMLHETRARLEQVEGVLDTATDGVVVVTEEGVIESLNRSAEALFGYEAGEVKGKPFTVLFAAESHRLAVDYLDGLSRGGMASLMNDGREVTGKVRQGGHIPLHMSMGRVGTSGAVRYAAVLRDMTNWKRTERELREAKQAAENASVQKSSFLARVSHEIRTPLNAIIGFSELMMQERFGPIGNERYKDYLRDIHTSGGHMLSLLNDLLDLTKVEAGKLELKFEQVNLNDIAQQCVSILQPQASRDHIIIRSSLAPRLPKVVADERSMRQIITNLLSNSVKFTPEGGQVIISTAMTEEGEAVLRVRDTGVGMSEKELKMALEPFRQIANTNPRSAGGTGLGLPLTKALVEANRARFAIVSAPQEGTLVEVYFPSMRVLAE